MINFYPVKDGFLLWSGLGTTTVFTGKASGYFNGHKVFPLIYQRTIALLDYYFLNLAIFSLSAEKTDYGDIYLEHCQSVMSKDNFLPYSSF